MVKFFFVLTCGGGKMKFLERTVQCRVDSADMVQGDSPGGGYKRVKQKEKINGSGGVAVVNRH